MFPEYVSDDQIEVIKDFVEYMYVLRKFS